MVGATGETGSIDNPIRTSLKRLIRHVQSGELAHVCRARNARLLVLFGSAVREDANPNDIDLAVRFESGAERDVLGLLEDLHRLTGGESFDVMDLSLAGPVARERAMLEGTPLFEAEPHLAATEQIAATMLRMDSDWLRRLELETLAR